MDAYLHHIARAMSSHSGNPRSNPYWSAADTAKLSDVLASGVDADWMPKRRGQPLDRLLPATRQWAESLPESARPLNLLRTFPRIANRIAHDWQDYEATCAVLDDLLVDRRGGRRGFPPPVHAELLNLKAVAADSQRGILWR